MSWGWVYVIIAAVLVAMVVAYAVWLWHKASDVYAELTVLGRRAGQLADVLAGLDLSPLERGPAARGREEGLVPGRRRIPAQEWDLDDDPFGDGFADDGNDPWDSPD